MQRRPALLTESESGLSLAECQKLTRNWLLDAELSDRSAKTIKPRRDLLAKLDWFLTPRQFSHCGVEELRAFFLYLTKSHLDAGGRWGNPNETTPLKPLTLKTYYGLLRAFFNFAVQEGYLVASPMERIPSPRDNADEVQPFTDEQVEALLTAACKGLHPLRDVAILNVLFDTGMRASELCGLRFSDWDITGKQLTIRQGKGKKARPAYLGKETTKALWKYVDMDGREENDPLFYSGDGEAMTYNALYHLFRRLGQASGVREAHPHRCRHSFAISLLKNGGNSFALQRLLGHTSIQVTNRYVQYAQADLQAQHRAYSPVDNRKKGKGR